MGIENSTNSCIYKKIYFEDEVKVNDQDHVIEKYQRSVHQECYINFILSEKIPVVFHS